MLRHRPVMLAVFAIVLAATIEMFAVVPKGFIPDEDKDSMFVNLRAAQGTSYYDMARWTQEVAETVIKNPYVDSFMAMASGGSANNARMMVQLVPRAQRPVSAQQIARQIVRSCCGIPRSARSSGLPPALQIGGRMGNQNFSLMMQSLNTDELYEWAPTLEAAVSQLPEVQDVSNDMEMKSPRINLNINRDKAAAVGLERHPDRNRAL